MGFLRKIGDALIEGIPGLLGGASSAGLGASSARQQQIFSAREAEKARAFDERMSSTSWQRGVADMRAAGINPMLSFAQGGASSPTGPAASGSAADVGGTVSSAIAALRLRSELRLLAAQKGAVEAKQFKDMTTAMVDQQKLYTEGTPEAQRDAIGYRILAAQKALLAAQESSARSVAALNRADLPARRITGGKWAGVIRGYVAPLASSARQIGGIEF